MSHRNVFKKSSARTQSKSPLKSDFVPIQSAPKIRRPYGASGAVVGPSGLLYAPGGTLTQPVDPGHRIAMHRADESEPPAGGDIPTSYPTGIPSKKEKQWNKWNWEVLPAMLNPYLQLLRETDSLRNLSSMPRLLACLGCFGQRKLTVSCIYFESTLFGCS